MISSSYPIFFFFVRAAHTGRPNPVGYLPSVRCGGLLGKVNGSSLSPSATQLHLGQMYPCVVRGAHGHLHQSHQPLFRKLYVESHVFRKLQHSDFTKLLVSCLAILVKFVSLNRSLVILYSLDEHEAKLFGSLFP